MSIDKKKTLEELEAEMDALTGRLSSLSIELQEARRRQAPVPTQRSLTEQELCCGRWLVAVLLSPRRMTLYLAWKQSLQVLAARARSQCIGGFELQLGSQHIRQRQASSSCQSSRSKRHNRSSNDLAKQNSYVMSRVIVSSSMATTACATACAYQVYNSILVKTDDPLL